MWVFSRSLVVVISIPSLVLVALLAMAATSHGGTSAGEPTTPVAAAEFSCADVTEIPQLECEALVALYNSTSGPGWSNNGGWLATNSPCAWHGVRCNEGHVTELRLNGNQLSGTMPTQLGNLVNLHVLSLYDNALNESIPSELGNLINLAQLDLHNNQLSGTIPAELGNAANLSYLSMSGNQLSGAMPPDLGNLTSLWLIDLSSNQLSGAIPPALGNLANLVVLLLWENQLSGNIPTELGNLTTLGRLEMSSNQLSGAIPPQLGNLASLTTLLLQDNQLSGPIPPELGNLNRLNTLYLHNNQLSGAIPAELGNLASLQELNLSSDQLSGTIPSELGNLTNLKGLYLYRNQLSGAVPAELGNLANLLWLWLFSNQLTGTIPPELADSTLLREIELGSNQIGGAIPAELGNLTKLERLHLYRNQLIGPIPPQIGNVASLRVLSLGTNQLSGIIPSELANLASLQELYLQDNLFDGPLSQDLTALNLVNFWFNDTDLCEPPDEEFQGWLASIPDLRRTGVLCSTLIADFTSNVTSGDAPLTVQFTDTSSGSPTSWQWNFGDGTTSIEPNPSHTYGKGGIFTVKLTVSSAAGNDTQVKYGLITVTGLVSKIAFMSYRDGNAEIYTMDAIDSDGDGNGDNLIRLTNHPNTDGDPSWAPDGTKIVFSSTRNDHSWDVCTKGINDGDPVNCTSHLSHEQHPSWSPDGKKIVISTNRVDEIDDDKYEIYVIDSITLDGEPINITRHTNDDREPAWSPDGDRLAFVAHRDGNFEVYVMKSDGSTQTNCTNNPFHDINPSWSPDGANIAFASERDGDGANEIFVMKADCTDPTIKLTEVSADDRGPSWSPDGTRITFSSDRTGDSEIYMMNAAGAGLTRLTNHPGEDVDPVFSPAVFPQVPRGLARTTPESNANPTFVWDANPSTIHYQVKVGEGFESTSSEHSWIDVEHTSYTVPDPLPQGEYNFQVRAVAVTGFAGSAAGLDFVVGAVDFSCADVTEIPQIECEALVALYQSTDGPGWISKTDWLATETPCGWFGVGCGTGHVMHLLLHGNQLSGAIPPELGNLAKLVQLDLASNQLSGVIPAELGNLASLRFLYLWANQLSGAIPAELGNLEGLELLDLSSNQLSGVTPAELGNLASLVKLYLSYSQLSGALPHSLAVLNLNTFWFNDTDMCEPPDEEFQAWLAGIPDLQRTGVICATSTPSITGSVTLQFREDHGTATVTATADGFEATVPVNAGGSFVVGNVPDGTYTLVASAPCYLSAQLEGVTVEGVNVEVPATELRGGDVDGSGFININDITSVVASFGQLAPEDIPCRDINASGLVNINDITGTVSSFGKGEPQPW